MNIITFIRNQFLYHAHNFMYFFLAAMPQLTKIIFKFDRSRYLNFGKYRLLLYLNDSVHEKMMYLKLYEYPLISFLRQNLKPGDTFIDVGANIGYFTTLALSLVGFRGQTHAFEPDPRYFKRLQSFSKLNSTPKNLYLNNVALGDKTRNLQFKLTEELGTSTLVSQIRNRKEVVSAQLTKVIRLDNYLRNKKIRQIKMIKIDVEGYEIPVLFGLTRFLTKTSALPLIHLEYYPYALKYTEYRPRDFKRWLNNNGYEVEGNIDILNLKRDKESMYHLILKPTVK